MFVVSGVCLQSGSRRLARRLEETDARAFHAISLMGPVEMLFCCHHRFQLGGIPFVEQLFLTASSQDGLRSVARRFGENVQLRKDGLPEVLRAIAASRQELQEEEVRTHQPAATQEEAQVVYSYFKRRPARRPSRSAFNFSSSGLMATAAS